MAHNWRRPKPLSVSDQSVGKNKPAPVAPYHAEISEALQQKADHDEERMQIVIQETLEQEAKRKAKVEEQMAKLQRFKLKQIEDDMQKKQDTENQQIKARNFYFRVSSISATFEVPANDIFLQICVGGRVEDVKVK